ncbi:hypothetical protein H8E88_23535 [candidate division KSB1 bacterium]|nr:hypothetical protein [candidate division KSB1 bacterium]MBL7094932.1 hypothetical protein [candidate division KSB1 bacterium]
MKTRISIYAAFIMSIIFISSIYAQEKSKLLYATDSGLGIQFGGEVEMEFVDVEGKGGFAHREFTYQKVRTRSPHMRIDKAVLETKIFYSEFLTYEIQFRFGDDGNRVDKHFARLQLPSLYTRFEMGKNRPFIRADRRTEGYPLIGTANWKGREYHITSETKYPLGEHVDLIGGVSFAMKRPLGSDDAAEDKSFKILVYDDYDDKDGQTFEYGAMFGFKAYGLSALGWYYTGKLIDDFDWKTQLSQYLSDYNSLGDQTDKTHYWYGGRVGYDAHNIHARGEYIKTMDGLLPRFGYYGEVSYFIKSVANFLPVKGIEPLVRYGALNVLDHPRQLGTPETWDRQMTTIALLTHLDDYLSLKFEYYLLNEETGGDPPEDKVKDNQFLMQVNFKF